MNIRHKKVNSIISKTRIPESVAAYAINPYVGCPHKCRYCYACFMKRFTGHTEPWGDFIDIKDYPPVKDPQKYAGSKIVVGTVTDGYNPYEAEYKLTQRLLEQFVGVDVEITITTKSNLILRDIQLLKRLNRVTVSISVNTLDEKFRADMDAASSIRERIETLLVLRENRIKTVTFISPIFPGITVVEDIVEATSDFCDLYWLENLNLRGGYKHDILEYVHANYPHLSALYHALYVNGDKAYWHRLTDHLNEYAKTRGVKMVNYFFHEQVRQ